MVAAIHDKRLEADSASVQSLKIAFANIDRANVGEVPPVSFCDVDGMYRWRNIRAAAGGACADTASPEGNDGPPGRPDGECDGTHVVFLHGYNVNEREARAWARAVFKRLWWAGMESMFTAVAWHGTTGRRRWPTMYSRPTTSGTSSMRSRPRPTSP